MDSAAFVNWLAQGVTLRVWFWFVGVVGMLPILFRVFRYDNMLDVFGTGELLIVSTLICGAAVERSFSRMNRALRTMPALSITSEMRTQIHILQDCTAVNIVIMIISCAWYGYMESRMGPSPRVVWPSITIAACAYALGAIAVWLDD
jgi:hypothetical protein